MKTYKVTYKNKRGKVLETLTVKAQKITSVLMKAKKIRTCERENIWSVSAHQMKEKNGQYN